MFTQLRPAIVSLLLLTLITGVAYPALVTLIARVAFPNQAAGSIITRDGKAIGSRLIAQGFTDPKYFWPRPSAAAYSGTGGSGSNLGPTNPALVDAVKQRVAAIKAADTSDTSLIPVDLVTSSASGLDPHISAEAAYRQAGRVAAARHLPVAQVKALVDRHVEGRTLGVLGEARVNVLLLNLALDGQELLDVSEPGTRVTSLPWRSRGFLPE